MRGAAMGKYTYRSDWITKGPDGNTVTKQGPVKTGTTRPITEEEFNSETTGGNRRRKRKYGVKGGLIGSPVK